MASYSLTVNDREVSCNVYPGQTAVDTLYVLTAMADCLYTDFETVPNIATLTFATLPKVAVVRNRPASLPPADVIAANRKISAAMDDAMARYVQWGRIVDTALPSADIGIDATRTMYNITISGEADILALFNKFQASPDVPFMAVGTKHFKVFRDMSGIPDEWCPDPTECVMYVRTTASPRSVTAPSHYSRAVIKDMGDGTITMMLDANLSRRSSRSKTDITHSVASAFIKLATAIKVDVVNEDYTIWCNNFPYSIDYTLHLLMNGGFHHVASVNEHTTLRRRATTIIRFRKMQQLHVPAFDGNSTRIALEVRNAENEDIAKYVFQYFRVVSDIAMRNMAAIKSEYAQYGVDLPDIGNVVERQASTVPMDVAPKIFTANAARTCQASSSTTIVTALVADKSQTITTVEPSDAATFPNGKKIAQAYKFPLNAQQHAPEWYACVNAPSRSVLGLRGFNGNDIGAIPCCYTSENGPPVQRRTAYYESDGETVKVDEEPGVAVREWDPSSNTAFSYLYRTKKFLKPGSRGVLPDPVALLFSRILFGRAENTASRISIGGDNRSFLMACAVALKVPVEEVVEKMRAHVWSASQSLLAIEDLNQVLSDANDSVYIQPSVFAPVVEEAFKCRIIVFSRTVGASANRMFDANTELRHHAAVQGFYHWDDYHTRPTFAVIEHYGAEADAAKTPRVDIIAYHAPDNRAQPGDTIPVLFQLPAEVNDEVTAVYNTAVMYSYSTSRKVPVYAGNGLVRQYIDSKGKVRVHEVLLRSGKRAFIYVDPHPVFGTIPVQHLDKQMATPRDVITEFLTTYMPGVEYKIHGNAYRTTVSVNGLVVFGFVNENTYRTTSVTQRFMFNRRAARYFTDTLFKFFSTMFANVPVWTMETFRQCATMCVVDTNVYTNDSTSELLDGSAYIRGNTLLAPSQAVVDRVPFILAAKHARDPDGLRAFASKVFVKDPFIYREDFRERPNTVIFSMWDAVLAWSNRGRRMVARTTFPDDAAPFFAIGANDVTLSVYNTKYVLRIDQAYAESINVVKKVGDDVKLARVYYSPEESAKSLDDTSRTGVIYWARVGAVGYFRANVRTLKSPASM